MVRLVLYRGRWYAAETYRGETRRVALRTADRAVAERRLADLNRAPAATGIAEAAETHLARNAAKASAPAMRYAWNALTSSSEKTRASRAAAGAQARWAKADPARQHLPKAICGSNESPLRIGDIAIPCYVLEDETRVLTSTGMSEGLGLARGGSMVAGMNRLELFASRNRIKPYISSELAERIHSPLVFITPTGGKAYGYAAEILVQLCEVVLAARQDGVLQTQQLRIAQQCEILTRGLARVGIVGLVDEATGYQTIRARTALEKILNQWLTKELQPWRKQFPDDYYKRIFELNGWPYDPASVRRPGVIGGWTNDMIYARLGPGLKEQLHDYAGRDEEGRLKHHLHRYLTSLHGLPELQTHMAGVLALMKAATNWRQFKEMLPKPKTTLSMAFDDLEQIGAGKHLTV